MMHSIRLTFFMLITLIITFAYRASAQTGIADNFGIDGNLLANSPVGTYANSDDWVDGPAGSGSGVLTLTGIPKVTGTSFHISEVTGAYDPSVFSGSEQLNSDPNGYIWLPGTLAMKYDIENALLHLSVDANGELWLITAVDRAATNDYSYIHIEFLQNMLYFNEDSTITSLGPHGGRTEDDLLLVLTLSRFGGQAIVDTYRWTWNTSAYEYSAFSPPAGSVFAAANIDSQVTVPYGALGSNVYDVNHFGETAVNISQLIPGIDGCPATATVFIHTRKSASMSSFLVDVIEPIQVSYCSGTSIAADTPHARFAVTKIHPNPFKHSTQIEYILDESGLVLLELFDIVGRRVTVLNNRWITAGPQRTAWDGRDSHGQMVSSGIYFCRLSTTNGSHTQKIVLIR